MGLLYAHAHFSHSAFQDGKGAMTVDTVAQDGMITVENVMFYKDANLASEQTAEADWQRRGLYIGPRFSELDESLQALFVRYLEERGINDALATFLPEYVEYKEQKEYTQWLENMKSFVSAWNDMHFVEKRSSM